MKLPPNTRDAILVPTGYSAKPTANTKQEERVNEVKEVLKLIRKSKKDWKSVPKWASQYETDVTFLLKALAKAQKPSV